MNLLGHPALFRHLMNLWPPYLGAGIRVAHIAEDWQQVIVHLRKYFFNRNYRGTHFGGSLYAMTDPFYALMLIHLLGKNYSVWDKAASIDFLKPVGTRVQAVFTISGQRLRQIRNKTQDHKKHFEIFEVDVTDKNGDVVARVEKTIYIRKVR